MNITIYNNVYNNSFSQAVSGTLTKLKDQISQKLINRNFKCI